ncbi:putative signal peptide-containing [Cryptosporidium canis]|uniref:Signal peptide-containing n=1 Tax=Cryptosporidium canis TaxID=195482 RepID=A0ABQ8P4Z0_9CRYT|nr:putative signal peptide-containing [Cryptosporidium canis]
MTKEVVFLIIVSILVKSCFFLLADHDLEEYTNGFFNTLGQNFGEVLELCAFKEYGNYTYYGSKRVNFPVIALELVSTLCSSIHSSGKLMPFIITNLIQILQGLLIYSYLNLCYPILSALSETVIEKKHYQVSVIFLLGLFWINPISVYTCSLLSFGAEIELLIQLLLLWISVHSSHHYRALLPIISAINVYYSPNISTSLIPASLSLFLLGNSHHRTPQVCPKHLGNFKAHFAQSWNQFCSEYLNSSKLSKIISFFISFLIIFFSLHALSFLLVHDQSFTLNDYIQAYFAQNFTLLENKDLSPYLNIHWFLMSCINPEFRLFFQIILGSSLSVYASIIIISLENIPFKALQSQLLICFVFKSNPTFTNYLLIFFFILFDSFTVLESKISILASLSFVTWMTCIPLAFLIRPIWILDNLLESNLYYFLTLIGHFSIFIFIGEWIKSLFDTLVKSNLHMYRIKQE